MPPPPSAPTHPRYCEDPPLFLGERGVIHMISHGELGGGLRDYVGLHSVSADGVSWMPPKGAYTLSARWSPTIPPTPPPVLGRREAPQTRSTLT